MIKIDEINYKKVLHALKKRTETIIGHGCKLITLLEDKYNLRITELEITMHYDILKNR